MRTLHVLTSVVVVAALVAVGWVAGQRSQGIQAAGTLTGADIAEIEQLYARYNQGLDFRDRELFMSAFADDAVYTTGGGEVYSGTAGLTEWVTPLLGAGPATVTHNNTSILITPTADGAKGRGYWFLMNVEQRVFGEGEDRRRFWTRRLPLDRAPTPRPPKAARRESCLQVCFD